MELGHRTVNNIRNWNNIEKSVHFHQKILKTSSTIFILIFCTLSKWSREKQVSKYNTEPTEIYTVAEMTVLVNKTKACQTYQLAQKTALVSVLALFWKESIGRWIYHTLGIKTPMTKKQVQLLQSKVNTKFMNDKKPILHILTTCRPSVVQKRFFHI